MNEFRFEGIIIGHEDWGDVDRIVSFYTPHFGKLEAVARGVRYEKSKLKGHLEFLTRGSFSVAAGRGRPVLTDALAEEMYPLVRTLPERAYAASAIAACYDAYTLPGMPDEALWDLFCEALAWLDAAEETASLETRLRSFFERFLAALGYRPPETYAGHGKVLDLLFQKTELSGPLPSAVFAQMATLRGS